MNRIEIILIIYFFHAISTLVHECGHLIAAKIGYNQFDELSVGNFFFIKINDRIRISPIVLSGYVSIEQEKILSASKIKAICFFLMGICMNAIMIMVGIFFVRYYKIFLYFIIVNVIHMVTSIIPFGETDLGSLVKVLVYKNKYDDI